MIAYFFQNAYPPPQGALLPRAGHCGISERFGLEISWTVVKTTGFLGALEKFWAPVSLRIVV